jgi:alkylation response protein AidB-like acyl-CoA dehydrogenase
MNTARIGTAVQGLAASEGSFQGALAYAKDRLAMRSLSGPSAPEKKQIQLLFTLLFVTCC